MSTKAIEIFSRCKGSFVDLLSIHSSRFSHLTKQLLQSAHLDVNHHLYRDSLFGAVADQLRSLGVSPTATPMSVRLAVCDFLDQQRNRPMYRVGSAAESPAMIAQNRIAMDHSFSEYLAELRHGERDGDALCLQAVCDLFQVQMAVLVPAKNETDAQIALRPTDLTPAAATLLIAISGQWFLQFFSLVDSNTPRRDQPNYDAFGNVAVFTSIRPPPVVSTSPAITSAPETTPKSMGASSKKSGTPSSAEGKKRKRVDGESPGKASRPFRSTATQFDMDELDSDDISASSASPKPLKSSAGSSGSGSAKKAGNGDDVGSSAAFVPDSRLGPMPPDFGTFPGRFVRKLRDVRFASIFRSYLMRFGSGSDVPTQNQVVFWQIFPEVDKPNRKIVAEAARDIYLELLPRKSNGSALVIENMVLSPGDIDLILRLPSLINSALYFSDDATTKRVLSSNELKSWYVRNQSSVDWWSPAADLIVLLWIRDWGLPKDWASECQKSTFLYMLAGVEKRVESCLTSAAPLRALKPNPKHVIDREWNKFAASLLEWLPDTFDMLHRAESLLGAVTPTFPANVQPIIADLLSRPYAPAFESSVAMTDIFDQMARVALLRFGLEYKTRLDSQDDNPIWRLLFDPDERRRSEFVKTIDQIITAALPDINSVRESRMSKCRLGSSSFLTAEDVARVDDVTIIMRRIKEMNDDVAKFIVSSPDYKQWSERIPPTGWWSSDAEMIVMCYIRDGGVPVKIQEELNAGTLLYEMGALMDQDEIDEGGQTLVDKLGLAKPPLTKINKKTADEQWELYYPQFKAWCADERALVARAKDFVTKFDVWFVHAIANKAEFQDKLPAATLKKMLLRFGAHPTQDDSDLMVEKFAALKRPGVQPDQAQLQKFVALLCIASDCLSDRLIECSSISTGADCGPFQLNSAEVTSIVKLTEARTRLLGSKIFSTAARVQAFRESPQFESWATSWRPQQLPWYTADVEFVLIRISVKWGLPIDWLNELDRLKQHLMGASANTRERPYYLDIGMDPLPDITRDMTVAIDLIRDKSMERMLELANWAESFNTTARPRPGPGRSQKPVLKAASSSRAKAEEKKKKIAASSPAPAAAASPHQQKPKSELDFIEREDSNSFGASDALIAAAAGLTGNDLMMSDSIELPAEQAPATKRTKLEEPTPAPVAYSNNGGAPMGAPEYAPETVGYGQMALPMDEDDLTDAIDAPLPDNAFGQ